MRKKTKFFGLGALAVLCFSCVGLGSWANNDLSQVTTVAEDIQCELKTKYLIGETITLPEATIEYNDQTLSATAKYVRLPDNRAKSVSTVSLEQAGLYTVCYTAESNGKEIVSEVSFNVLDELYSVEKENSAITYGAHEYTPNTEGLNVKLGKGDTFSYNKVIDVSDKTVADKLLQFYITPNNIGVCDASQFKIRLTDAYDESNYVEMLLKNVSHMGSWADIASYVVGNAAFQRPTGMQGSNPRTDWSGYTELFTMCGKTSGGVPLDQNQFSFSVDYATKQLWCATGMVIDLDNPDVFTELWDGFTTGECFLSIEGLKYQASTLNFVITNLIGTDLQAETLEVQNKPMINVDCDTQTDDFPYAKIGKPFTVFSANATSAYQKEVAVKSNVYYNYGTSNPINVSVVDGKFTPTRKGIYSIVYSAKDNYGFETTKVVDVEAKDVDALSAEIQGQTATGRIAQRCKIFNDISIKNASGAVSYQMRAVGSKATYTIDDDFTFYPEYADTYKIEIVCNDYLEEKVFEFELEITKADVIEATDSVFVPKYMIRNAKYQFEELYAKDYSSGEPKSVLLDIYVSEDGKDAVKLAGDYTVNATESVEVIYRGTAGSNQYEKSYSASVVDTGYGSAIDMRKYFVSDSENVAIDYDTEDTLTLTTNENASFEFINAIDVKDFSMNFNGIKSKANFQKLHVYMIDTVTGERVKFTFTNEDGVSTLYINDKQSLALAADFAGYSGEAFKLFFTAETGYITSDKVNSRIVDTYESGKKYNGFYNNLAYLVFSFEGVKNSSGIQLFNINRHVFANIARDLFAPNIYATNVRGDREINDKVTINSVYARDVLDPWVEVVFTITTPQSTIDENVYYKDPAGNVFDGSMPCDKDYEIVLNEYGTYIFDWVATDGAGRKTTYSFGITVIDRQAPTITLSNVQNTAKVGEEVSLATYTVKDNVSADEAVKTVMYVQDEGLNITEVINGKYTFQKSGVYRIMYYAFDESGNAVYEEYFITVE